MDAGAVEKARQRYDVQSAGIFNSKAGNRSTKLLQDTGNQTSKKEQNQSNTADKQIEHRRPQHPQIQNMLSGTRHS